MDLLLKCENLIVIVYRFSSGEAEVKLFCFSQSYLYTITESSFSYYRCYCVLKKGVLKENLGFFFPVPLFTTMIFLEVISSSISRQKGLYLFTVEADKNSAWSHSFSSLLFWRVKGSERVELCVWIEPLPLAPCRVTHLHQRRNGHKFNWRGL